MSPISTRICVPNLVAVRRSCRKRGGGVQTDRQRKLQLYIVDDIVKVSTVLNPVLFAGGTSLFHAHTDFDTLIEEINEELQKITTWFHTNKRSLNIKKSNFIILLAKGKKYNTDNVKININGNEIKEVNFTNFLGIYIDEPLSWAQHIDYLSKKIARNVGILSTLKHFLPMYIMNTLYYSLILSKNGIPRS